MDKVDEEKRNDIFSNRESQLKAKAGNFTVEFFPTSIWENTLYKAWSKILVSIVPNKDKIKELLERYAKACQADEVVLFEKNTLLYISSYNTKEVKDNERFEKICFGMKKFKNTCYLDDKKYNHFLIKNKINTIYLQDFENSTSLMVILPNNNVSLELLKLNLEIAKKSFREIMDN